MLNDNFYRSSGSAIAMRVISQSQPEIEWFFAGCSGHGLEEDLSWMPLGRYECFNLKTSRVVAVVTELFRFRRWIQQNRIDLVHCQHRRLACLLRVAQVPVLYVGQLAFEPAWWFRLFRPKYMTAITSSVAQNILVTTGVRVLATISNPVVFPARPPAIDVASVRNRAVCIARLEPIKGHVHLLNAWSRLCQQGEQYHLDIVGEGTLLAEISALAARLGIAHLVHFKGFTSDVGAAIRCSLFAILVSEIEGQGIVTLEAAAHGRPSLLTAVTGSIDMIPPGAELPNGIPFADEETLAEALRAWFAAPPAVVAEGRRFFSYLQKSCDPHLVGKQYTAVYQQILSIGT